MVTKNPNVHLLNVKSLSHQTGLSFVRLNLAGLLLEGYHQAMMIHTNLKLYDGCDLKVI